MRIFLTGGTGQVGSAVVKALLADGHSVTTLARSDKSAEIHKEMGATPLRGSLTEPDSWVKEALSHEAIVHAAATFDSDMGDVDHNLVSSLLKEAKSLPSERRIPFIYTGGCWLYPESPVIPLTERHVLDPLPAFDWMLDSIEQLHQSPTFLLTVIHPALVVSAGRGLIADYAKDLIETKSVTIINSADTHFPFVQADDLADLYLRALKHQDNGLLLNATAIKSATAEDVGRLVSQSCNIPYAANIISIEEAQQQHGQWIAGFARSQRMEADRARDLLGWEPKFTTIEAMVKDSLAAKS